MTPKMPSQGEMQAESLARCQLRLGATPKEAPEATLARGTTQPHLSDTQLLEQLFQKRFRGLPLALGEQMRKASTPPLGESHQCTFLPSWHARKAQQQLTLESCGEVAGEIKRWRE